MGFFYRFVAAPMSPDFNETMEAGRLTLYSAMVFFSIGVFLSNLIFNSIMMKKPFVGSSMNYLQYFSRDNIAIHFMGVLGSVIWNIGMSFSIIASGVAGLAVSYELAGGANDELRPRDIEKLQELVSEPDVDLMQLETPLPTVSYPASLAKSLGKKVILNPALAKHLRDKY